MAAKSPFPHGRASAYPFHVEPVVSPLSVPPAGGAEGGGALPGRLKVLRWGDNPNARGKSVRVGPKFLRALSAPTYPYGKVAIDFEHNTVPGTPEYERTSEPRPVAGFAEVECVEGEGVFLRVTRWTPEGLAHARDYEDLSAAPVTDAEGDVVALPSVALCRTGAVPGIEFVECPLSAVLPEQHAEQGETMDYKAILAQVLGLGPEASDEELKAAADALAAKAKEAADKAAREQEALSARVEALEKGREEDAKQRVILAARMEGKVVSLSAEAIAKLGVKDLEEHVAALPATVPLSAATPAVVKEPAAKARPSEQQERIYALCGMTAEEVEKWA